MFAATVFVAILGLFIVQGTPSYKKKKQYTFRIRLLDRTMTTVKTQHFFNVFSFLLYVYCARLVDQQKDYF
jgi:hypothetical protein